MSVEDDVKAAITEYGEQVVRLAFSAFTKPLLPFCHLMVKEQVTNTMAKECGLDDTEVEQAFRLMKSLKASTVPHNAYVACETIAAKAPLEGLRLIAAKLLIEGI